MGAADIRPIPRTAAMTRGVLNSLSAADIQSSGGADIAVGVSEQLVAQASGGSDIVYTGEPAMVSVNASGGADITQR